MGLRGFLNPLSRGSARRQMDFVSSLEGAYLAELLESVGGANVLLVGETTSIAVCRAELSSPSLEDGYVRFRSNTAAADRASLKFGAKLLFLAKIVHDEEHSKGG